MGTTRRYYIRLNLKNSKKKIKTAESGVEEDQKDWSEERKAALLALERVKNWKTLDPKNPENQLPRFLGALRNIKKDFTVESKKFRKKDTTDLDGRSALQLFRMARMNVKEIHYVHSGNEIKNTIHLDTGKQEGFVVKYEGMEKGEPYTGQTLTVYFDHHAKESKRGSSATKYAYETLRRLELLPKDAATEKAVEFVTQEDNRSYPNEQKYYKDSPRTLLGLGRYISFEKLCNFFEDGLSPVQKLTDEQLEIYDLVEASEIQQKVLANTEPMYKELEKDGFVVDSKEYGKILVDIGAKFNSKAGGFVGAKAMGADTYIIWSPKNQSFMLSTSKKVFPENLLPQGERMRETMWIKGDKKPLNLNLTELLRTMSGRNFRMNAKMTEALRAAEQEAREKRRARTAAAG